VNRSLSALAVVAALVAVITPVARAAAATDSQIKAEVNRQLARLDPGAARLTVEVKDGVVSLSGDIATLWLKEEAIRRALKVPGVQSLEATLTIPRAENDRALVRDVADRIRHYDLYTVYDSIEGRVNNGKVRLEGAVTEEKKSADLLERVAKVKGVQAIDNRIEILPTSQSDDRLRVVIATAIYNDQAFGDYSMVDPPVHVIVNNGHVVLVGYVRSQIERIKAESIARSVHGVLALENRVQLVSRSSGE
jgi:hyperosmotically inducible periplasmic protein